MKITKEQIQHIAVLSRLNLSEEEKDLFGSQLSSILDYMDQLNELDTRETEPTSHVLSLSNVMRDDILTSSLPGEEALKNAPSHSQNFYRVPRIIE
ncbi:MAG: Asp-tRNA(Asn)/Glu-tRNA(Gln) amidotransferase subunit GatC [Thermodesulfovibrionales bacterium]